MRTVNYKLLFDLNLQLRYGIQWDPTNTASLLGYVNKMKYHDVFNFELGNGKTACFFLTSKSNILLSFTRTKFILKCMCINFRTRSVWRIRPFEWNSNRPRFRHSAQSFVSVQFYKVHFCRTRFGDCLLNDICPTFFRVCRLKLYGYSQTSFVQ